MGCVTTFRSRR